MAETWDAKKEELLFSWTNQLSMNRKAHHDASVRCRRHFYFLKVLHIFILSVNVGMAILNVGNITGALRTAFIIISILVALSAFFLDQLINMFGWSEAGVQHAATVRELDSLRFEMQREYYTSLEKRREWEPLMVFISERMNQINSVKTSKLLIKDFDDSMVDIMSMQWKGLGDSVPRRRSSAPQGDEMRDLMDQADIYNSMHKTQKEKPVSIWRRLVKTVRQQKNEETAPRFQDQPNTVIHDDVEDNNVGGDQFELDIQHSFPEEEIV